MYKQFLFLFSLIYEMINVKILLFLSFCRLFEKFLENKNVLNLEYFCKKMIFNKKKFKKFDF